MIEQDPGMGYDTGIIMFGLKKNKLVADKSAISKALSRRLEPAGVFPSKEEAVSVLSQRPCRVYLGIDPTGPDIHLGHTIPLLFLKELWQLGHQPIILIGNFTAQVGDPTGKSTARPPLSASQVAQNSRTYTRQMSKILPKDAFKVQYNNDWLGKLKFGRILELASQVTVQQMIQGVLAGFIALLVFVLWQFGQASLVDWKTWALAAAAFIALRWKVDLLVIVSMAALISIVIF